MVDPPESAPFVTSVIHNLTARAATPLPVKPT
jgi:hypothetical protein